MGLGHTLTDDHRRTIGFQRLPRVPRHSHRIAHVMQAIEERDHVELLAGVADRIALTSW
jgi:hypothetical protein